MATWCGRLLAASTAGLLIISGLIVVSPAGTAQATASQTTASNIRATGTQATASDLQATINQATGSEARAAALPWPSSVPLSVLAAKRPSKVRVPARYVYDPKLGARHDYCTLAPDEFPAPHAVNADFRGPCARHDLCYDGKATKKSCDKALRRNMFRNCRHYYGRYNPLRTACKVAAVTYWAAVVAT